MSLAWIVVTAIVVFFVGALVGVVATVSLAIRREDRRYSLVREPPDMMSRGTRRLIGVDVSDTSWPLH